MRERPWNKKCVRDAASLFMRTPQTNSLCFSTLHQMHFIFLEHICRNQFWEMESLDLFAWDKMGLCDHCRQLKFFFFFQTVSVKTFGVSILSPGSWKKTSNIIVGKPDDVCFDYSLSQKSARLWNIRVFCANWASVYFMFNMIARYIFPNVSIFCYLWDGDWMF